MKVMTIQRIHSGEIQTLGVGTVWDDEGEVFEFKTLELAWKGNAKRVSCIPVGTYKVKKHNSPANGKCFELVSVPGRTHIQIHAGNFHTDILGCILVGSNFVDINKDDVPDVVNSRATLNKLLQIMPDEFDLEII